MRYIAHKDGEREQLIKEHLEGTAERAGEFAEKFGKKEWGYCCGMLHDIGKYSIMYHRHFYTVGFFPGNADFMCGMRQPETAQPPVMCMEIHFKSPLKRRPQGVPCAGMSA